MTEIKQALKLQSGPRLPAHAHSGRSGDEGGGGITVQSEGIVKQALRKGA
jgi:hypothetical protein